MVKCKVHTGQKQLHCAAEATLQVTANIWATACSHFSQM